MGASNPRTQVPLEEGVRHGLLHHGVYLTGNVLRDRSGGGVFHLHLVRAEDGSVVTAKGVGLNPRKLVVVVGKWHHEAWKDSRIGHCEGWCRIR